MAGFEDVYGYIAEHDEKAASEIYFGLEYLFSQLEPAYNIIKNGIHDAVENEDEETEEKLKEYRRITKDVKSKIEKYLDLFTDKEVIEEVTDEIIIEEDETTNSAIRKDYSKCAVDQYKPHLLSEDYTKTKTCAFMFNKTRYEVDNAQDMLVTLCGILYKENPEKFQTFDTLKKFKGRKITYFGRKEVTKKNKKIPNSNMYVWINMSCNGIMRFIKKILIECGHKPNEFYVYIRSDFNKLSEGDQK